MIKQFKSKMKHSSNPLIRFTYKTLKKSKTGMRLAVNSSFRGQWYMEHFNKDRVQQTTQLTWEDRYPDVFSACQTYFSEHQKDNIRILSYGCCTGEEVVTLRRYFPNAVIVGAELNKNSLKICRRRKCDENIHFIYSRPENIKKYGPYDAVFCMAVLERLPMLVERENITDLKDMYPFEKYNLQIHEINEYVKKDGLLISHFTHYDIMDTDLKDKYVAYGRNGFMGFVFGPDSQIKHKGFQQSIYIKTIE